MLCFIPSHLYSSRTYPDTLNIHWQAAPESDWREVGLRSGVGDNSKPCDIIAFGHWRLLFKHRPLLMLAINVYYFIHRNSLENFWDYLFIKPFSSFFICNMNLSIRSVLKGLRSWAPCTKYNFLPIKWSLIASSTVESSTILSLSLSSSFKKHCEGDYFISFHFPSFYFIFLCFILFPQSLREITPVWSELYLPSCQSL